MTQSEFKTRPGKRSLGLAGRSAVLSSLVLGGLLLQATGAHAAPVTKNFTGDRTDDVFLNLNITYDDATTYTVPSATSPPAPGGWFSGTPGTPCSATDTTGPYTAAGDCYINTDGVPSYSGQSYLNWPLPAFTGKLITSVTGTVTGEDGDIYNVIGLAKIGSFEGGKLIPVVAPLISHYISDNLIDPTKFFALGSPTDAGMGISQGGFVVLTDNPDYQYQLFQDPTNGELAGCGSGTCLKITPVPAPLPILGVGFAFGSIRKARKFSSLLNPSFRKG